MFQMISYSQFKSNFSLKCRLIWVSSIVVFHFFEQVELKLFQQLLNKLISSGKLLLLLKWLTLMIFKMHLDPASY